VALDRHAYHNFKIMGEIEQSPRMTNRSAARKLGVSVKLAHEILAKLAKKGLLHIRKHNSRRWDYFLTPHGIAEKARLTVQFLDFSMEFYREARRHSAEALKKMHDAGGHSVAFLGATELAEIASLGAREWGQTIVDIFDDRRKGDQLLGLVVRPLMELENTRADHILVTAFDPAEPMARGYVPRGVAEDSRLVWVFSDGSAALEAEKEVAQ
jgi:DNA-binding MarR family transcriptional regulator